MNPYVTFPGIVNNTIGIVNQLSGRHQLRLLSPVIEETPAEEKTEQDSIDQVEQERQSIVDSLTRRVRYLLTLKGRPPFRMAGIEMYQGLREVCDCLEVFIAHIPDERLIRLHHALSEALKCFDEIFPP